MWERFTGGRDGSLWYYRSVLARFHALGSPLAEELAQVVARMDELAQ